MNQSKSGKKGKGIRIISGLILGAAIGFAVSHLASSAGSQCMILCNQGVAVPYFAAVGGLVAWR
jgi:uncharacterized membrane protein